MNEHTQTNQLDPLLNLLFDDGLQSALPRIAEILMNAAMMLERETHIGAAPYQRGVERNGYANGFKPRTFQTAIGALKLSVPQVRESDRVFSTSLLEKGSRESTMRAGRRRRRVRVTSKSTVPAGRYPDWRYLNMN